MRIPIGTKVTCKETVEAYYSNYGITPECYFKPGMQGELISYMPSVRRNVDFAVVDFKVDGKTWRVGLDLKNLVVTK